MKQRAYAAEAIGSLILAACVIGSGIMAERLAGGNVALALLANTFATCGILIALISSLSSISGAHFNPLVSLVMYLRGVLDARSFFCYLLSQTIGMLLGVALAHLMFELPIVQSTTKIRTGAGQWMSELVASFVLLLTILRTSSSNPNATPYAVAAAIMAGYWFTASTSFANPAITLARSFTDSFSGIAASGVLPFILAQLLGALAALGLDQWWSERQSN